MLIKYVKHQEIDLKNHPEITEKQIQEIIAKDPSILGLGNIILKDKERRQPHAGRLDLLFQNADTQERYEVEIQLGKLDESHIIRTIEYWDIEKKRYPQYDHYAVIIAEDITSRFLNIINLFNGVIPLIAIQMKAIKIGDSFTLVFTKVLDSVSLGMVDEDEEVAEITDRSWWEQNRGTKETVAMADEMLNLIKQISPEYELKYNKFYIGLAKNGQPDNFVIFKPQKNAMLILVRMAKDEEFEKKIEETELNMIDYDTRSNRYRFKVKKGEIEKNRDILLDILRKSYEER